MFISFRTHFYVCVIIKFAKYKHIYFIFFTCKRLEILNSAKEKIWKRRIIQSKQYKSFSSIFFYLVAHNSKHNHFLIYLKMVNRHIHIKFYYLHRGTCVCLVYDLSMCFVVFHQITIICYNSMSDILN